VGALTDALVLLQPRPPTLRTTRRIPNLSTALVLVAVCLQAGAAGAVRSDNLVFELDVDAQQLRALDVQRVKKLGQSLRLGFELVAAAHT